MAAKILFVTDLQKIITHLLLVLLVVISHTYEENVCVYAYTHIYIQWQ